MIIDPTLLLAQVAWETMARNVRMISDWTYVVSVSPENLNDVGAGMVEVGFFFMDNNGNQYSITAINVDGVAGDIEITDDFKCGYGAVSDRTAIIYQAVGDSRYLAQVMYQRLDSTAQDKGRAIDLAVLWDAFKKNFIELLDCPDSYTDQALKSVRVKNDETGLEFYSEDRFLPLIAGDSFPLLNPLTAPSINLSVGAGINKVWQCTNEITGAGHWGSVSTDQHFVSTWNATTNIPTLADGVGTNGYYHLVTTGGTINLGSGDITFNIGDKVIYNGSIWEREPKAETVGFPLTKTDDTNITLTLGGSPSTALLSPTSIAVSWAGLLADNRIEHAGNWNTSYSWWDHHGLYSLVGHNHSGVYQPVGAYLTSETDPTVSSWAKAMTKPDYTKSEVGLSNVDNTSDVNKPISTAQNTAINNRLGFVKGVTDLNNIVTSDGFYDCAFESVLNATNSQGQDWCQGIQMAYSNNPDYKAQLLFRTYGLFYRAGGTGGWKTVYDSGNLNLSTVPFAASTITASGTIISKPSSVTGEFQLYDSNVGMFRSNGTRGTAGNGLTIGAYSDIIFTSSANSLGLQTERLRLNATTGLATFTGDVAGFVFSGTTANFIGSITSSLFTDGYTTYSSAQINRPSGFVELQYFGAGGVKMFGNTTTPITFNTNGSMTGASFNGITGLSGSGSATTVSRSDHNHAGTYLTYRTFGTAANNNTGDFAAASHTHTKSQITDFPTDIVTASADTYTSRAKALSLVTLTQAEYDAIETKDSNTLYIIS